MISDRDPDENTLFTHHTTSTDSANVIADEHGYSTANESSSNIETTDNSFPNDVNEQKLVNNFKVMDSLLLTYFSRPFHPFMSRHDRSQISDANVI